MVLPFSKERDNFEFEFGAASNSGLGGLFTQGLRGGAGTPNGLHRIRKNPIQFIRNNSQNILSLNIHFSFGYFSP